MNAKELEAKRDELIKLVTDGYDQLSKEFHKKETFSLIDLNALMDEAKAKNLEERSAELHNEAMIALRKQVATECADALWHEFKLANLPLDVELRHPGNESKLIIVGKSKSGSRLEHRYRIYIRDVYAPRQRSSEPRRISGIEYYMGAGDFTSQPVDSLKELMNDNSFKNEFISLLRKMDL